MRTRTGGAWRTFAAAGFLTIAAFLVMVSCASVPNAYDETPTPQVLKDAAACLKNNPGGCTVFQIENNNWEGAKLYLNNGWMGYVEGKSPRKPMFIQNWRLDAEHCARITVVFRITAARSGSDRTCVAQGEFYDLTIEQPSPGFNAAVWLVPRFGK